MNRSNAAGRRHPGWRGGQHLHGILRAGRAERLPPGEEDIHKHAEAPPVHGAVVAMRKDVLWSDVSRRPTEGVRAIALIEDLCKAKVADLRVAVVVDEDILRLQVPVNDVVLMQVLQGQHDAGDVEARQQLLHALHTSLLQHHDAMPQP